MLSENPKELIITLLFAMHSTRLLPSLFLFAALLALFELPYFTNMVVPTRLFLVLVPLIELILLKYVWITKSV